MVANSNYITEQRIVLSLLALLDCSKIPRKCVRVMELLCGMKLASCSNLPRTSYNYHSFYCYYIGGK